MTPIEYFQAVWNRADKLSTTHAYLAGNVTGVLKPDEMLCAEWVMRVSALDLYIHELVAQDMLEIFEGRRATTQAFLKFQLTNDVLMRIKAAATPTDASAAFELEVRSRLGSVTYQDPEKIADGIRLISDLELWNEVALKLGATSATRNADAKALKTDLSLIVERRNKIVHEGDLQPIVPRSPWPISTADLSQVKNTVRRIVDAINSIV